MAGSGKTTFIQRFASHLSAQKTPPYIINMDPAVLHVPYSANIDIRDTVKYKNVMKQYNLGPNGGILTSCNLFATRFDQAAAVIGLCEKARDPPLSTIVLDTPGQIEIFTWSASGQIVTELFASSFPTVVAFIVDTPRCAAPQTFMSNMLQAVSILYKTKLPMILVFNKTDVMQHDFALEWMADFEVYQAALEKDGSYAATLSRSLSLVLDEFYSNLRCVGVSALTGQGMDQFCQAVSAGAAEYEQFYVPELAARQQEKADRESRRQQVLWAAGGSLQPQGGCAATSRRG
ncbi:GPN-loop GTPase [Haematococcus lacustris]